MNMYYLSRYFFIYHPFVKLTYPLLEINQSID